MNYVLDLDGVLANFAGGFENLRGKHLYLPEQDLSKEDWKAINKHPSFWKDLPALPGARYLTMLGTVPDNVYILTSRGDKDTTQEQTYEWFKENDIDIPESRIFFARPRAEKVTYLKALAPCRFIDDSITNVDFCGTLRDVDATLMLQPYNAVCATRFFPSMHAVKTLKEFMERP